MNMLDLVDEMIIGGGMAYTFNKVLYNCNIGDSIYDDVGANLVPDILAKAATNQVRIHLPTDNICGDDFSENANTTVCAVANGGIHDGWQGLDIGPETIAA